jgi:glyoxylase-like metal-dependent hydrolase (beta-lactamase superfamily II)
MLATGAIVLSDGVFKVDGGAIFGRMPKMMWENFVSTDRKNRVTMGLNCLLLQCDGRNILVDTGVGPKDNFRDKEIYGLVPSRLLRSLKSVGLGPRDIDAVVLSHLHFSHAGGATRMDRVGDMVPSFPNATYYVQRASWQDAQQPSERHADVFRADDFGPIAERDRLHLLDGDIELFRGLNLIVTEGHCPGHQLVVFSHGGERIVYLGDLVPTPHHLGLTVISSYDYEPETTMDQKRAILDDAEKQGWLLVFSHGHETRAGYLERRQDTSYLRPVEF